MLNIGASARQPDQSTHQQTVHRHTPVNPVELTNVPGIVVTTDRHQLCVELPVPAKEGDLMTILRDPVKSEFSWFCSNAKCNDSSLRKTLFK